MVEIKKESEPKTQKNGTKKGRNPLAKWVLNQMDVGGSQMHGVWLRTSRGGYAALLSRYMSVVLWFSVAFNGAQQESLRAFSFFFFVGGGGGICLKVGRLC